jgi:hypothetical protein
MGKQTVKYKYILVYKIYSNFALPLSDLNEDYDIFHDSDMYAFFTKSVDKYCYDLDRGKAIRNHLLAGLFRNSEYAQDTIDKEIKIIQVDREREIDKAAVLVIICNGNTIFNINKFNRHEKEYVVYFDGITEKEENTIKEYHKASIQSLISAIYLEGPENCKVNLITKGIYFQDEQQKIIYSYSPSGGEANIYQQQPIDNDLLADISRTYTKVKSHTTLVNTYRLLTEMLLQEEDRLRIFLFAWTALEMFINKVFTNERYGKRFMIEVKKGNLSALSAVNLAKDSEFSKNLTHVKNRFIVISYFLNPHEITSDFSIFDNIRQLRNEVVHEQGVTDDDLPINDLRALLAKYLKLYL